MYMKQMSPQNALVVFPPLMGNAGVLNMPGVAEPEVL